VHPDLSEEQIEQINEALFAGQKIAAIKIYREATSQGLKDSKEFIEAVEARLRQEMPEKFTRPAGAGCGAAVLLLLWLVIAIGAIGWAAL
jgi:hypothetical protein